MRKQFREPISRRELRIPKSEFGEFMKLVKENKKIISLGPGEPDFPVPKNILNATKHALDSGLTKYSEPFGIKELREVVAKKMKRENKISADPEKEIIITNGSSEALFLANFVAVDSGEEVIVQNPGYMDYVPDVKVFSGSLDYLKLSFENNFQFDIDDLKKKISRNTRILILNSPSNPTGTVFNKKLLEEIADLAIEKNLLIFSDEAYEKYVYGKNKHVSIGSLNGMKKHVVTFGTFSKTYAMMGFRIGYAVGPQEIISAMGKTRLYSSICSSTFSQYGALEALSGSQSFIKKNVKDYECRGKFLHKRISEIGFECLKPQGAFYLFPKIPNKMSSDRFTHFLINKAKVLVIPGTEFGKYGEGFVRMSYATSMKNLEEATDRIERAMNDL